MARLLLESSAISAFCESIAIMLSAGIQTDEAAHMLGENMEDASFKHVCDEVYGGLIEGKSLAAAMRDSQAFPAHVTNMVDVGEKSGRTENVLRSLAVSYDEEGRLFAKIRSSIGYPAALLCIMSIILAFTVAVILPVFVGVYDNLTGSLTTGSFAAVNASIIIGWVALGITIVCTVVALAGMIASRSQAGRLRIMHLFEGFPATRQAMYQMALSRFTSTIATYVASGVNTDEAMRESLAMVEHAGLRAKLQPAYESMIDLDNAKSLAQAIYENEVYEPIYARMLMIGTRSGSVDKVLDHLSTTFFDDAVVQIDRVIDSIEPALAAFLTIAVGATLISVMLPLIGIMGSIG